MHVRTPYHVEQVNVSALAGAIMRAAKSAMRIMTFANERSRKAIEARPVPRGIRKPGVAPPLLAIPLSQLEGVHLVPDVGDHDAILVSYDPLSE